MPTGGLFYVDAESLGLPKRIPVPEVAKHSIELREAAREALSIAIWRCLRRLKALGVESIYRRTVPCTRPDSPSVSDGMRQAPSPSV
jgi:hypothetical protein